jgi:hypothetical protein
MTLDEIIKAYPNARPAAIRAFYYVGINHAEIDQGIADPGNRYINAETDALAYWVGYRIEGTIEDPEPTDVAYTEGYETYLRDNGLPDIDTMMGQ